MQQATIVAVTRALLTHDMLSVAPGGRAFATQATIARGLQHGKPTLEISIHHAVMVCFADLQEVATDADGGIVHQAIHVTKLPYDWGNGGLHVFGV